MRCIRDDMKTYNLTTKTSRKALTPRHDPYPARVHKGLSFLLRKLESEVDFALD